jgi:hypothetical protein
MRYVIETWRGIYGALLAGLNAVTLSLIRGSVLLARSTPGFFNCAFAPFSSVS